MENINSLIFKLTDCIKQDQKYINFIEAEKKLKQDDVASLLNKYQSVLQELEELKKYDKYIDNSSKKEELKDIKRQIANNQIIQEYYQCYHEINDLLDKVTKLIFSNISEEIDMTGINI